MKSEINITKGLFRLRNIVRLMPKVNAEEKENLENIGYEFHDLNSTAGLIAATIPIDEGIAIEKKVSKEGEEDNYIVLAYVKPDKDGDASVELVGTRLFDEVSVEEYLTVRALTKAAFEIVEALQTN